MDNFGIFDNKRVMSVLVAVLLPLVTLSQSCSTGKVDEQVAGFLKAKGPDQTLAQIKAIPIEQIRKEGPKLFAKLPEDSVKRIKITKDNIKVNVVRASSKSGLPIIINFHSGGFIKPLLPWMEYEAMRLSGKFNAVVFDVDYRVAPENKFPTAVNDSYNSFLWVLEHGAEYGGDPTKIILTGTSAGANLAALIVHKAKKEGKLQPIKLVILNCPPTDNPMTSYYTSYEDNARSYLLTKDLAIFYFESYLDKSEWYKSNPEMWPIHEKDLSGLPSHLIITTEFDVLRDEGIAYGETGKGR
jgi:acetyl esterase